MDIGKASEGIYILSVEGEQNRVIQKVITSNLKPVAFNSHPKARSVKFRAFFIG
jgi:hypothetical protein